MEHCLYIAEKIKVCDPVNNAMTFKNATIYGDSGRLAAGHYFQLEDSGAVGLAHSRQPLFGMLISG
jgi:hypothetical protein